MRYYQWLEIKEAAMANSLEDAITSVREFARNHIGSWVGTKMQGGREISQGLLMMQELLKQLSRFAQGVPNGSKNASFVESSWDQIKNILNRSMLQSNGQSPDFQAIHRQIEAPFNQMNHGLDLLAASVAH